MQNNTQSQALPDWARRLEVQALVLQCLLAVAPVDALGGFNPVVNYAAAYVVAREVVSREFSVFVGDDIPPPVTP